MQDAILSTIQNLGFPVAIAVYLIVDRTRIVSKLQNAIEENTRVICMLQKTFEIWNQKK